MAFLRGAGGDGRVVGEQCLAEVAPSRLGTPGRAEHWLGSNRRPGVRRSQEPGMGVRPAMLKPKERGQFSRVRYENRGRVGFSACPQPGKPALHLG